VSTLSSRPSILLDPLFSLDVSAIVVSHRPAQLFSCFVTSESSKQLVFKFSASNTNPPSLPPSLPGPWLGKEWGDVGGITPRFHSGSFYAESASRPRARLVGLWYMGAQPSFPHTSPGALLGSSRRFDADLSVQTLDNRKDGSSILPPASICFAAALFLVVLCVIYSPVWVYCFCFLFWVWAFGSRVLFCCDVGGNAGDGRRRGLVWVLGMCGSGCVCF